ncbi:MAG: putative photosynthetic complex assembly protein PuhE [Congregibacter sp.]|nr:putative photosynthetic complex assembly protein PuhE [Congregibacter sp.]MDP5069419.1 putative photosynthetic complex assembly protein PuhE [Congregibacter sp.]
MIDYLLALGTVTLAWWISTGLVLLINRLGPLWQRASMLIVTLLVILSLIYLPGRSQDHSAAGALMGFGQGLIIWAWLEMTYLMGVITGPRKLPCPSDVGTLERFWLGIQTSLYHEISVISMVAIVVYVAGDGPNQVAAATCISLWLMRWSAKLNLFLGVRNYNSDWFPAHLKYLDSYTRRAPMNLLFPVSVTVGTTAAVLLLAQAMASTDPFLRSANLLVSALLSLAVLEHWFLMYPFGESVLWRWALAPDDTGGKNTPDPAPDMRREPRSQAPGPQTPLNHP